MIKVYLKKIYLTLPAFLRPLVITVYYKLLDIVLYRKLYAQIIQRFTNNIYLTELRQQRTVRLIQPSFYNADGTKYLSGGAERYLLKLCALIQASGRVPFIIQQASSNWVIKHDGIIVIGISSVSYELFNKLVHHDIFGKPDLTIYSPFSLAYPIVDSNAIGISHGIFWDHSYYNWRLLRGVINSWHNLKHLVSVDTSTISWFKATPGMQMGDSQWQYIPNYVDLNTFYPEVVTEDVVEKKKIILFPRRLYAARGFFLVEKIIDMVLSRYQNVEFHFVGQCHGSDVEKAKEKILNTHSTKVQFYEVAACDIHQIYKKAYITLIPTIASEGTSFSCLEAMACGNAVIATNVGGLTDLIIDQYNGLLITPNENELFNAINALLSDDILVQKLSSNAVAVARAFGEDVWEKRWQEVLAVALAK